MGQRLRKSEPLMPVRRQLCLSSYADQTNLVKKEIDEHRRAGHAPYRSLCKCCVEGRGIHDQHQAGAEKNKLDKSVPCVSLDFAFMGDEVTEASSNAIVCTYDHGTDSIHTYATKRKGAVDWLSHAVSKDLEALGYSGCRI